MNNNDDLFPKHEGGKHSIKELLDKLNMDRDRLINDPRYKEGYDDGYNAGKLEAQNEAKCIIRGLTKLYNDTDY